jgi:hypothetical protein
MQIVDEAGRISVGRFQTASGNARTARRSEQRRDGQENVVFAIRANIAGRVGAANRIATKGGFARTNGGTATSPTCR